MARAISLPFSFDSDGGITYSEDPKKIWQDRVVLTVMTSLGERVMRPTFGSNVGQATFENLDAAVTLVKEAIGISFGTWLPQLTLVDVLGKINEAENTLNIEIVYRFGQGVTDAVSVTASIINRAGELILEVGNG